MKRAFLVLCVLTAFGAASWAQLTFPTADYVYSLTRNVTAKLISDEIDQSFTANGSFGAVQNPFVMTGVMGNYRTVANVGSTPYFSSGFYKNGDTPFSLFGSFYGSATTYSQTPTSDPDSATSPTKVTDVTYDAPSIREFDGAFQGLVKLSSITTGLYFEYHPYNGSLLSAAPYSTTTETYYTTAATATVPLYADNYTVTTEQDNLTAEPSATAVSSGTNTKSPVTKLSVPLYIKTGNLENKAFVSVILKQSDSSGSYSVTTSPRALEAAAATTVVDIDDTLTNVTKQTAFELNYQGTIPSLIGGDSANYFTAGVDFVYASTSSDYSVSKEHNSYTVGALNTKTLTSTSSETIDSSFSKAGYISMAAMAAHTINYKPSDGYAFVLKPQLVFSYSKDPNGAYSDISSGAPPSSIVYTSTSTGGATTVITQDYDSSASVDTTSVGFNLPTALKIKPEGWPFGFFAGSTGYGYTRWTKKTSEAYTVTEVVTPSGGTPTTTSYSTNSDSKTVNSLYFGEIHSFGIFFPFANDIRADIYMNGNNLLVFDNLQIQLYVPLK